MPRVEAIVVNKNSSAYTELLLRSLHARNGDAPDLHTTVKDCHSTDTMSSLEEYAGRTGVEIELCSDRYYAAGNSHGEILREFVLEHPHADYYLFLDSDVAFVEDGTVRAMEAQLSATPDAFGIQALLSYDGANEQPIGSDYCFRERIYLNWMTGSNPESVRTGTPTTATPMYYRMTPRLHPCCSLVKNSEVFRLVAEVIGFSCAHTLEVTGGKGFDTFALLTQVMRTHSLRHIYATKMVLHFGGICCGQDSADKRALRDRLLEELRTRQVS